VLSTLSPQAAPQKRPGFNRGISSFPLMAPKLIVVQGASDAQLIFVVDRAGKAVELVATPRRRDVATPFGNARVGVLGVQSKAKPENWHVPQDDREFYADEEYASLYAQAIEIMRSLGAEIGAFDYERSSMKGLGLPNGSSRLALLFMLIYTS
jgi:hypothetical protein